MLRLHPSDGPVSQTVLPPVKLTRSHGNGLKNDITFKIDLFLCGLFYEMLVQYRMAWARSSAVSLGTALQVGRSRVRFPMVSLEFFH